MNKRSKLSKKDKNKSLGGFLRGIGPVYYALLILMIIGILSQPTFSSVRNVRNIIISTTPWAIASIGQTLTLLIAGIDLSIGSIISLSNTIAAFLMKDHPDQIAGIVLICILSGTMVGFVNGIGVAKLRLNPFIFTLATGITVQGITLAIMYQPGGLVTEGFLKVSRLSVGPVPIALFYIIVFYAISIFYS